MKRAARAAAPRRSVPDGASRHGSAGGKGAVEAPASLTIGELAERAGVTAEAIRYYEREGVVPPAVRGGAGRYRQYGDADTDRLRFIRRARDLGFSLNEVRELLALTDGDPSRPCAEVDRIARSHLTAVDAKLAQLAMLRTELARIVGECAGGMAVAECRIIGALSGDS